MDPNQPTQTPQPEQATPAAQDPQAVPGQTPTPATSPDAEPKKKGFFARLFGKKDQV